jgi:hypothetical protein
MTYSHIISIIRIATVLALSTALSNALAQTPLVLKANCMSIFRPVEALGDREGHSLAIAEFTCRFEGGPLAGAVGPGSGIYEWNGPNGVALSSSGIYRKPGVHAAWINTDMKLALTIADGRPVGATTNGRGRFLLVTGSAAALSGKSYSFTSQSTGPGVFSMDVTLD